jgi:hypothetical protein
MASDAHEEEAVNTTATAHSTTDLAAMETSRGDAVPVVQATELDQP